MRKTKKHYISKRLVARGSKRVFKSDASKALRDNGYVIVAKDGWIVKEFADGVITKLRRIEEHDVGQELVLD